MEPNKKQEFTAPYVKAFKLRKRVKMEVEYDTLRPGLSLRGFPTGETRWKYHYRFQDRPRVFSIGDAEKISLSDAREKCRELDSQVFRGIDPQTEKTIARKTGNIKELVENYLNAKKDVLKASGFAMYRRVLWGCITGTKEKKVFRPSEFMKRFGSWKASDITNVEIFNFLKPIKQRAPGTARVLVAAIGSCFKWGASLEGGKIEFKKNPLAGITMEKSTIRESVLKEELIPKFWNTINDEGLIATALKVILLTGQRPGEVLNMRWEHLDFGKHSFNEIKPGTLAEVKEVSYPGGWWEMPGDPSNIWPGTKNKKSHKVWLTPLVLLLLGELAENGEREPEGYVFKSPTGLAFNHVGNPMRRACKKMGFEPGTYRPHDLRRTFATMATDLKLGREAMGRVLNHQRPGENESDKVYDWSKYKDDFRKVAETITERVQILLAKDGIPNLLVRKSNVRKKEA